MKEDGKSAVINPKNKFVVDPSIQWHRCKLIVVHHASKAGEKAWRKLRKGVRAAAQMAGAIRAVRQKQEERKEVEEAKQRELERNQITSPSPTSPIWNHGLPAESLAPIESAILSMSAEMQKIGEAVRLTQERVEQQNTEMQFLTARMESISEQLGKEK
jgi:hypothetical protein